MAISLSPEARERALASIRQFYSDVMEDDIGDLKASLLLAFFLQEIGPTVYNQAISEARVFLHERVEDIDGTCFEPEFSYWKR